MGDLVELLISQYLTLRIPHVAMVLVPNLSTGILGCLLKGILGVLWASGLSLHKSRLKKYLVVFLVGWHTSIWGKINSRKKIHDVRGKIFIFKYRETGLNHLLLAFPWVSLWFLPLGSHLGDNTRASPPYWTLEKLESQECWLKKKEDVWIMLQSLKKLYQ